MRPYLYIIASMFIWSSWGVILKITGIPVHTVIFFSSLVSATALGIFLLKKKGLSGFSYKKWAVSLIGLGLVSLLNTYAFFYAYQTTSIANAVLTHYTAPVFVAFLAPLFLGEKLTLRAAFSVAIATAGLWIMIGASPAELYALMITGDNNTIGILAGLFSGLAYAFIILILRKLAQALNPLATIFFQNSLITLFLIPMALKSPPGMGAEIVLTLLITGLLHSTLAPFLYVSGMKHVTANNTAILGYFEPVCSITLGFLMLGEAVGMNTLLGGAMILFSGYLTIRS
ncbi:MAG: DMT family transporter [Nitrospirae bacterium]|nr:MAG: DMT family transporter [Nitrospirota bacterium]